MTSPEPELAQDEQREVLEPGRVGTLDPGDEADRERDRHRVVPAGLGLERARESAADLREAQGCEHRCGVGGRDHRTEKERLEPREVEERPRRDPGQEHGDDDSDGAQQGRRRDHAPEPAPRGLQSALEQDQDEADDSDLACELGVVEVDTARPVRAEEHSEREEEDQDGDAGTRGAEGDQDTRRQQRTYEQESESLVHRDILAARAVECPPLEQDLGCRHGVTAAVEQLDGVVQIDLADGDPLREMHGIARLEEDVQSPALDFRRLVLAPERSFGRLCHARVIRADE